MLLSRCGPCGRAIKAGALRCPNCGALAEAGTHASSVRQWHWLVALALWFLFGMVFFLNR